MTLLRHRTAWLVRTPLLLVPAAVLGCASEPTGFEPHGDARLRSADGKVTPLLTGRFAAPDIAATFDEHTGATRTLMAHVAPLTAPAPGSALAISRSFALDHTGVLGLSAADLADLEVTDVLHSRLTGITNVFFRQRHQGLPVYNAQLQLNIDRDGRILSVNNSFFPNLARVAGSASPSIGADLAVASAAASLGVELAVAPSVLAAPSGAGRRTVVDAAGLSAGRIEAELMWLPLDARQVALTWRFQVETLDGNHHFDYTVDADSGKVWTRIDWTAAASYRAYQEPIESPDHSTPAQPADGRVVVVDPATPTASPLGWHGDGTTSYTIHRGNNVHAYDDRDANGAPPATEPACTATLDCDFPIDLASAPSAYTPAAVSNLFYWNNLVHDVLYEYGFDEANGNFQVDNFGNGGAGNDAVRAEAQDGSGTNGANFSTPVDGSPPRMQMFEWTLATPRRDGALDSAIIVHEHAHGISNRLVGGPSNVSCLGNAQQGGEGWSDWYALWFTARPTDVGPTARGIGTYVLGQPTTGPGFRTQRYSTDPAVNTWTYASITGMAVPHGVGSVWAQALWEVYWALVDQWGYSANLHDAAGSAGNQRAMLYVTQGLKNTACSPTFLDARDGIIAAAQAAHGGEDVCLLWQAFAAFGLGTDASTPGPSSTTATNGFSIPAACQCGGGGGLDDNFETGATGWTATGLWHLADHSTCANPGYASATRAFYYGQDATCNYNTGAANSGTLTSPAITGIVGSSMLSFQQYRRVESYTGGAYDQTRVDVIRTDGTTTRVYSRDSRNASSTVWGSSGNISLSAFAGDTIRLRFTFNTVDSAANTFTGWLIDDVKVTGSSCEDPSGNGLRGPERVGSVPAHVAISTVGHRDRRRAGEWLRERDTGRAPAAHAARRRASR